MPTFHAHLIETKIAYDNKQWKEALACLQQVDDDPECSNAEKARACDLRLAIHVQLSKLATSEDEKQLYTIANIEECLRKDMYTLLASPEAKDIVYIGDKASEKSEEAELQAPSKPKKKKKKKKDVETPCAWEQSYILAEQHRAEGHLLDALSAYETVLELYPKHWKAAQHLISIYFTLQEFEKMTPLCHRVFEEITLNAPVNITACFFAHYYLATSYLMKRDFEMAMSLFLKAEEIKPGTLEIILSFGKIAKMQIYTHHQDYTFETNQLTDMPNPELTRLRALYTTQSITCFQSALLESPHNIEAHTSLAEVHLYNGNLEQAKYYYQKLLILDARRSFTHRCKLAQIDLENQDYTLAIQAFHSILSEPAFSARTPAIRSDLHFYCGIAFEKMEDYNNARIEYAKALMFDPTNIPACLSLERLMTFKLVSTNGYKAVLPEPQKALPLLSCIINSPINIPSSKAFLIGLCGHVYGKLKNIDLALKCYQFADSLTPSGEVERTAIARLESLKALQNRTSKTPEAARLLSESMQLTLFQTTGAAKADRVSNEHAVTGITLGAVDL